MSPEVISLLSSPEVEPQSTLVVTNMLSHVPPSAQKDVLDDDLDHDYFDLTTGDVPPESASKTPARKEPGPSTFGLTGDSQDLKSIQGSARNMRQKEILALDVDMSWLSSDSFPDIDHITTRSTTGGERTSEPARKRQRLSPVSKSNSPKPRLAQTHIPAISKSLAWPGLSRNSSSRVIEGFESSRSPHISSPNISKASKPTHRDDEDDDDPFASPHPRLTREQKGKGPASAKVTPDVISIDDSDDDDPFADSPLKVSPNPRGPSRAATTAAAAWDPISSSAPLPAKPSPHRPRGRSPSGVSPFDDSDVDKVADPLSNDEDDFPDISDLRFPASRTRSDVSVPTKRPFTKSASTTTTTGATRTRPAKGGAKKTAEERAREREDKDHEKKMAAERKRRDKERERQQKAEEKQRAAARAEANKLKTRKETVTPEMIVDLPSSLPPATKIQIEEFLKKIDVKEINTWTSPVDNVVRWRRAVKARYNEERHHYDQIPEAIETEKFNLVILPAAEFAKLAMGAEGHNLEAHVLKVQRHFPNHQTVYLIEGLKQLLSKNRNKRNNDFASAVRSRLAEDESASTSSSRRTNKKNDPPMTINESQIDAARLQLQLVYSMQIHETTCSQDTAHQLQLFTQQVAVAPYKRHQEDYLMKSAGFCMDSGQVRTATGSEEAYVRMLQEVARITAPIAMGIANVYPKVGRLVRALEEGGPGTLEDVRRVINKEGEVGEKRVGKAVSKRLWKIFTGRDEMSTEV